PDDTLWIGTGDGVASWTGHDFERLALPAGVSTVINGLQTSGDGSLWIATPLQSVVRHPDGRVARVDWRDPVLDEPMLHMLIEDDLGARWFDSRSGLARVVDGRIDNVPLFSLNSRGMLRPFWGGAHQDHEGGLWFA